MSERKEEKAVSDDVAEKKAEERASLLRQGAGNYANLCGVLAGFVAVIMVLVLTPGFFPKADANVLFELIVVLFSVSSFGYIMTALQFIGISTNPLWLYKSLDNMKRDFAFSQYLVTLFTEIFLGGIAVLTYSVGAFFMVTIAVVGFIFTAVYLIKDWWALAKRSPPRKQKTKEK